MAGRSDYDSPWKELVEKYFRQFMEFFFPDVSVNIDWRQGYEFLDKEFQKIAVAAKTGRRYADKLVRVTELNGNEAWVLVHLEIQGNKDLDLARRMFIYHYRIFDRYQKKIASLALLADENINWRPDSYSHELWGCKLKFAFPAAKILDFARQVKDLHPNDNPFSIAAFSHLKALESRSDVTKRLEFKIYIAKALYRAKYDRKTIIELFRFLDWIMSLPEEIEQNYIEVLTELEEKQNMRYVTMIERLGMEKGFSKGREEGREESLIYTALKMLGDHLPVETIAKYTGLTVERINELAADKNRVAESAAPYSGAMVKRRAAKRSARAERKPGSRSKTR